MPTYQYQDREGAVLCAKGEYIFGVEKAELHSKDGNESIKLEIRIITKENNGPMVFKYLGFVEKAQWTIDVFLKSIQKQPAKGTNLEITNDWLTANVRAALGWCVVGQEEYPKGSGKMQNNIVSFLKPGDAKHPCPYVAMNMKKPTDESADY